MTNEEQATADEVRARLETLYPDVEWEIVQQTDAAGEPMLASKGRKKGSDTWVEGAPSSVGSLPDASDLDQLVEVIASDIRGQLEKPGEIKG